MIKISPSLVIKSIDVSLKYIILLMLLVLIIGMYYSFYASPADYQQGEYVRIMYVHVPSAWLALGIYSLMAIASFVYLIWRNPMFDLIAKASAPIGALFCFITLYTGSLWGEPIWGTWWVWDARLTSMLVLFFFYIGYIVLSNISQNNNNAPAALAIIGFVNVPIVKFSVNLWNSLHQPASVFRVGGTSIDGSMLTPLMIMFLAFSLYFIANLMIKIKYELIKSKYFRQMI